MSRTDVRKLEWPYSVYSVIMTPQKGGHGRFSAEHDRDKACSNWMEDAALDLPPADPVARPARVRTTGNKDLVPMLPLGAEHCGKAQEAAGLRIQAVHYIRKCRVGVGMSPIYR